MLKQQSRNSLTRNTLNNKATLYVLEQHNNNIVPVLTYLPHNKTTNRKCSCGSIHDSVNTIRSEERDVDTVTYHRTICPFYRENNIQFNNWMAQMEREMRNTVSILITAPEILVKILWCKDTNGSSPICYDPGCLYQMGSPIKVARSTFRAPGTPLNKFNNAIIRKHKCHSCDGYSKILKLEGSDFFKKPFEFKYGIESGKKFYIRKIKVCNLGISLVPDTNTKIHSGKKFIASDRFTNEILINWYVNHYLSLSSMNHINLINHAFYCSDHGYILQRYYDKPFYLVNFNTTTVDASNKIFIVESLVKQLVAVLDKLSDLNFDIGPINDLSLIIAKESSNYIYKGMNISSNWSLKLDYLSKASLTIKNLPGISDRAQKSYRLHLKDNLEQLYSKCRGILFQQTNIKHKAGGIALNKLSKKNSLISVNPLLSLGKNENILDYEAEVQITKTQNLKVQGFYYCRSLGVGDEDFSKYAPAFNFYGLMTALMFNKEIRRIVSSPGKLLGSQKVLRIWNLMWNSRDLKIVDAKLKSMKSVDEINNLILSKTIKRDIVTKALNILVE